MSEVVSVIIPVYNVEKYLVRCLNSVCEQTYKNIEVLMINDGSEDYSEEICKYFVEKDKRFTLINKKNGGQSSARNLGIGKSKGDYILFLDSDDWLNSEFVEKLYFVSKRYDADVVTCRSKDVFVNESVAGEYIGTGDTKSFSGEKALCELFKNEEIRFELWNKLIKKSVISETRFIENQIYEEIYFEKEIFFKMNKIVFLDETLHFYLKNREGNTNSNFSKKNIEIIGVLDLIENELRSRDYLDASKYFNLFLLRFTSSLYIQALRGKIDKESLKKIKNKFKEAYNNKKNYVKFSELLTFRQSILYRVLYLFPKGIQFLIKVGYI